ncbi:AJAP1 protein, partial [Nesospiza acunhae]|nr:AJAP1 protein [Nesospiza acunhae]
YPAALLTQSLSVHRSGCPLGSHAWILIAMFHLAMDLASCQPPAATGTGGKLSARPALRHRLSRGSLWGTAGTEELHRPGPPWTCGPAPPPEVEQLRSELELAAAHLASTEATSESFPRSSGCPSAAPGSPRHPQLQLSHGPGTDSVLATDTYRYIYKTAYFPRIAAPLPGAVCGLALGGGDGGLCGEGGSARVPSAPIPTVSFLLSAGLAVHQIITITVSLIMVIAALITTLVLKNCCAQSGRPRRNSHQRKLDQQEESCQNLTDFAPARVPSALDIFTAYNETLQCSHECVRTPVPVYAEDTLHSPGDYKTTFNGNRPSSSDRHLIPVAFVSEKWFEISC